MPYIEAGRGGPGGWACHTLPDGATHPELCHAGTDCPSRCPDCGQPHAAHNLYDPPKCPVVRLRFG
jgi:hypothetical protein